MTLTQQQDPQAEPRGRNVDWMATTEDRHGQAEGIIRRYQVEDVKISYGTLGWS